MAEQLAREKGARTACGICKRPLDQWGYVMLRSPVGPPGIGPKPMKRRICQDCYLHLTTYIAILEETTGLDFLPVEVLDGPPLQGDE